jgi:hypothetical protein
MSKLATSYALAERLKKVWPLPKHISSINIDIDANQMVKVTVEFYVDSDDVSGLMEALKQFKLVPVEESE